MIDKATREVGRGAISLETAFAAPITPAPEDFDELGHVNNAVYLRWGQEIAVRHWRLVAPDALRQACYWIVLRHEVDYRDPILPGDPVIARTWLGAASGARFDRYVDIRKPGAERFSASLLSTWVMIDAKTRRPLRVSREVFEAFGVAER
jgi:acyl-CoA thioester hydrolase